jgi:hypothetical protein
MIEQTEMVVKEWIYIPPVDPSDSGENIISKISLDVKKKTAPTKKGIACRFTCKFMNDAETILLFVGEDSYVIDFTDEIDQSEVLKMIMNSYEKFKEKFELRKLGTVLQDKSLIALDGSQIDLDPIFPLLQ